MKTRHCPKGISIIELTITLALGAMLAGGTFVWYSTQRSSQFYDGARQIESQIKQVQTVINANEIEDANKPPAGEILYSSVISADGGDPKKLKAYVFSVAYDPVTNKIEGTATPRTFAPVREIQLPAGVVYHGYRWKPGVGGVCSEDINSWTIDNDTSATSTGINIIAFRRDPRTFNFSAPGIASNTYAEQGGDNPVAGALDSLPCGVMWEFWSEEMINATTPRFKAEIVYNFVNTSFSLVTH